MQATLNLSPDEIDERLLNVIRELLGRDIEITLRNSAPEFYRI